MRVPFNDLKAQYDAIKDDVDAAIRNVIESTSFINGPDVLAFEDEFSAYQGGGVTIGCSNGTDALSLALRAYRIGSGDEVIMPAQSYIASAEAVICEGARPVFVDIDPDTYLIDVDKIEEKITHKTRAIMPVHLYGQACDMEKIWQLAEKYDLRIIEDAAQAHGAEYKGRKTGTLGDIAGFSFYPGKNLGAYGDAGAVTCKNPNIAELIAQMTNHGRMQSRNIRKAKYEHFIIGYNCRLDTIQAAILRVKLKYLDDWTRARQAIAAIYDERLKHLVKIPGKARLSTHVYHLYLVQPEMNRDTFREALKKQDIETSIHYPDALHMHKPIRDALGDMSGAYPAAERLAERCVSLPIYPDMSGDMAHYVCDKITEIS